MTPERLDQLAELADPLRLWRLPGMKIFDLSPEQRAQRDTGVALRRHAAHLRRLREALDDGRSVLITPLSPSSAAVKMIDTPGDHAALRSSSR